MKALDTNVLVRFLVKDDDKQARKVYRKFKRCEADKEVLFVPAVVVLETIWVLESVYDVTRRDILDAIDQLLLMPILAFEGPAAIRRFVLSARGNGCELSDLLIAHTARAAGCECVITFDKRASKCDLFELLQS